MPPISVTIFASQPGTYFLEDDGIPGNNFSQIRFPDGTVVTFEHPTDDLIFDPSVAGVTLVVNLTDTLGTANFLTGDFADPLSTPDFIQVRNIVTAAGVTLIANNAITEFGNDAAADVVASTLIMSATTGVGTGANALETQVGVIEAETNTGGITISNFGTVSIGGLTADVDGLDVLTSGNIRFTSFGAIVISDDSGPESIHGGVSSGSVFLTANGVDSDVIANIDQDSISAPGGNITVTAGRDISFGQIGANFDNDVRANGTVTFNPGRDLVLDGFADVVSDAFGNATGGDVIVNAGRNVSLIAVAGTDAGIQAAGTGGGNIVLNTGPGGTVTLNSGNGTAPFASLISNSGNIIVNADRMSIGTNGAISSVSGFVTIQPRSAGWEVDVGSLTDTAFALELSDAELDRIFTSTLNLGSNTSGELTVSSAISPLNALGLVLRSGADIVINASMNVAGVLSLRAGDNLLHAGGTLTAATLSGLVDTAGDDLGDGGFGRFLSVAATTIELSGNAEADTLLGVNGVDQTVHGFGGNDTITSSGEGHYFGDGGSDLIFAGLSTGLPEVLDGGAGIDTLDTTSYSGSYAINMATGATDFAYESFVNFENLISGDGADTITGTDGANTISTGQNNDTLDGAGGADTMIGGLGDDLYRVNHSGDATVENASEGTDWVRATVDHTLSDNLEILTLLGGARIGTGNELANSLFGSGGEDTLSGLGSDDILRGNDGRDTLLGGAGEDLLDGGVGKDTMTGGADRDVFQFRDGDFGPSRPLADLITDFSQADNEKMNLILVDADTTTGGNQAFSFIGTGAFTNVAGQLRYAHQGGNTFVEGDLDGDGTADVFIALTGVLNLVATDFVL